MFSGAFFYFERYGRGGFSIIYVRTSMWSGRRTTLCRLAMKEDIVAECRTQSIILNIEVNFVFFSNKVNLDYV